MRETENVSSCFVPVLTHWALAIALKGKGWLSKTICGERKIITFTFCLR